MIYINSLPGTWHLDKIITVRGVKYLTNHEAAEQYHFRDDGTFDKDTTIDGRVKPLIQNGKWEKGKTRICLSAPNQPVSRVTDLTRDTLVVKGKKESLVYKKAIAAQ